MGAESSASARELQHGKNGNDGRTDDSREGQDTAASDVLPTSVGGFLRLRAENVVEADDRDGERQFPVKPVGLHVGGWIQKYANYTGRKRREKRRGGDRPIQVSRLDGDRRSGRVVLGPVSTHEEPADGGDRADPQEIRHDMGDDDEVFGHGTSL